MSKGNICTLARQTYGGLARHSFYPPCFLSAVFVAQWRTGGPAHQVVKSVGLTLLFSKKRNLLLSNN